LRDIRAAVAEEAPTSIGHTGHLCELTIADVAAAAEQGDELCRQVLARAGHYLGRGLATLMTVINPRLVIISGEGVQAGHWRFDSMKEAIESTVFPELNAEIIFATEPLDDARWARGAACVVLGEIFSTPTRPSLVHARLG
jgi:predicted NBD/HSP70 family sugar kinase